MEVMKANKREISSFFSMVSSFLSSSLFFTHDPALAQRPTPLQHTGDCYTLRIVPAVESERQRVRNRKPESQWKVDLLLECLDEGEPVKGMDLQMVDDLCWRLNPWHSPNFHKRMKERLLPSRLLGFKLWQHIIL